MIRILGEFGCGAGGDGGAVVVRILGESGYGAGWDGGAVVVRILDESGYGAGKHREDSRPLLVDLHRINQHLHRKFGGGIRRAQKSSADGDVQQQMKRLIKRGRVLAAGAFPFRLLLH